MRVHTAPRGTFPVYSVFAESLDALVDALQLPCPRFIFLVAADTESVPLDLLQSWAGRILDGGATYVCCWGPGDERLHHAFDLAAIDRESQVSRADEHSVIMTTWHTEEPLAEAAWFAVHAAYPAGIFEPGTEAIVLAVVANDDWYRELVQYLDDGAPIRDAV